MSVSPAQNFSKPPPVPEMPTVTCTSGFSSLNSSAAASANGPTVDEPSIAICPLTSPPPDDGLLGGGAALAAPSSSSPHAATPNASGAGDGERQQQSVVPHRSILFGVTL